MSIVGRRRRLVLVVLASALVTEGCGQYTRRMHEFEPVEIVVAPGIRLAVSTSGFWETNEDGSVTSGSSYVMSVRVWGTGDNVSLTSLQVRDSEAGSTVMVDDWEPAVRDPSDSAVLLVDRSGVSLSHSTKQVVGELRVGEGENASVYPFEGVLEYKYREDKKNRFWQRLMGV